jgi:hypothetical protein
MASHFSTGSYQAMLGKFPQPSNSMYNWTSTVSLWLTLGRFTSRRGEPESSFTRLKAFDNAHRFFRWFQTVLGWLVGPSCFISYIVGCWHIIALISDYLAGPTKSAWVVVIQTIVFLITLGYLSPSVAKLMGATWHIIFGSRQNWDLIVSKGSPNLLHLEAIRVAMRERFVSECHDKAFSMLAILKQWGAEDVKVDYQESLSECFQKLFIVMVRLHPPAILMLCDAGIPPKPAELWTGPSWVPNWTVPGPNPGISSQLTITNKWDHNYTHFNPGDVYQVKDQTLSIIGAKYIGRVAPGKCLNSNTLQTMSTLARVCMWYQLRATTPLQNPPSLAGDGGYGTDELSYFDRYHDSTMFAILRGVPRFEKQPIVYYEKVYPQSGGRGGRRRSRPVIRKRQRERYEAPFDFTNDQYKFNDFLEFDKIMSQVCELVMPLSQNDELYVRRKIDDNFSAKMCLEQLEFDSRKDNRIYMAVADAWDEASTSEYSSINHWMGTGPSATLPGDCVFELPKVPGCMVLRPTTTNGEYQVVGCCLLPMVPWRCQILNITLV